MSIATAKKPFRTCTIDVGSYTLYANGDTNPDQITAYRTPVKREEAGPSYGIYRRWFTTFLIDAASWLESFNGPRPGVGDTFTDTLFDGITWTVHRDVDDPGINGLYRVACVNLAIDAGVSPVDTITIKPPVDSTDAYSSPITTSAAGTSYTARIQFQTSIQEDFQGVQYQRPLYRVFVAGLNADLSIGTLIVATAGEYIGTTFRVTQTENVDNFDELLTLTCTVDP